MKIGVVGLWHLGETVSTGLASLGHEVVGFDPSPEVIKNLQQSIPPLEEPGLREFLTSQQADGHLRFVNDLSKLADCEAIFLTFDTPVKDDDTPDTDILFKTVESLAPHMAPKATLIVMSQVPVGTTEVLHDLIKKTNPSYVGEAAYCAENLQLGKALQTFLNPSAVTVGVGNENAKEKMEKILAGIPAPKNFMKIASAEMTKHALNAFLATSLSFIYNIADLCEATGADISEVSLALKADKRIGKEAYLDAGPGFSGGTLMRDLTTLIDVGASHNVVLPVIAGAVQTNAARRTYLVSQLEHALGGTLSGKTIGILGVTYKPGTSTLRRSLSIELVSLLQKCGAKVVVHDPAASAEELAQETGLTLFADPYAMSNGCNTVVLITPWPEFLNINFVQLHEHMLAPTVLFDTRNFFKDRESEIKQAGFLYQGVGRS